MSRMIYDLHLPPSLSFKRVNQLVTVNRAGVSGQWPGADDDSSHPGPDGCGKTLTTQLTALTNFKRSSVHL